ncbi:MAG: protein translocase subunit SecD [Chitinispirillaceae bacterium]
MKKNYALRIGILIAILAVAVYFLIPSFRYYSKPLEARDQYGKENPGVLKNILNLGLDLQGGMRLVLQIDESKLNKDEKKDVQDRAYAIIENRINQLGVAEPVLQKQGQNRIIVELPGVKDEKTAKEVIGKTAQLEFQLLRAQNERDLAFEVVNKTVSGDVDTADVQDTTESGDEKEEQKLAEDLFGGSELESDSAEPEEGETEEKSSEIQFAAMVETLGEMRVVQEENVEKVKEILDREDVQKALDRSGLGSNEFLWSNETFEAQNGESYRQLYYLDKSPEMKGDVIENASATINQSGMNAGEAKVDIELNTRGARRFRTITHHNISKQLAIVLDNTVYSAPRIQSKISGGRAEITGDFTMEEAKGLAIILRAGALPAPVDIMEERTVGPSLGRSSIEKGMIAAAVGLILVVLFMLAYYKLSGIVALIALGVNLVLVLAVMAAVNATLTLPGIAGLILLIGMAVDANVLIFERIKEEIGLGKTMRSAINSGYSTAKLTILDANVTTLITAFILLWKGTGPIRGFAITLIFGIMASLFTALFVSRLLMDLIFQKKAKLSI